MKIKVLLALIMSLTMLSFAQPDDFTLPPISPDFHGTWIPKAFVTKFQQTLNFTISYRYESEDKRPHDILIVEENKVWSNLRFHDGYAISAKEFAGFRLTRKASGPSILDENGNSYIRISESVSPNAYTAFQTYLLREIQKTLNKPTIHPVVLIDGNQLRFQSQIPAGPPYEVLLDTYGFWGLDISHYNILLYSRTSRQVLGLVIGDKSIEVWVLYKTLEMEENIITKTSYDSRLIYRLNRR